MYYFPHWRQHCGQMIATFGLIPLELVFQWRHIGTGLPSETNIYMFRSSKGMYNILYVINVHTRQCIKSGWSHQ